MHKSAYLYMPGPCCSILVNFSSSFFSAYFYLLLIILNTIANCVFFWIFFYTRKILLLISKRCFHEWRQELKGSPRSSRDWPFRTVNSVLFSNRSGAETSPCPGAARQKMGLDQSSFRPHQLSALRISSAAEIRTRLYYIGNMMLLVSSAIVVRGKHVMPF